MPAPGDPGQHRLEIEEALRGRGSYDPWEVDAWANIDIPIDPLTGKQLQTDKLGIIRGGGDPYAWQNQIYNTIRQNMVTKQNQEQEGLFNKFEKTIKGQEGLQSAYKRMMSEAGVPGLQEQANVFKDEIFEVKDLLDRLGEDITSRTKGFNVSDAQRRRIEAYEEGDLRTQLGRLGTGLEPITDRLNAAMGEIGTMLGLQRQDQDRVLEPLKLRINSLSDRFAREISGFDQNRQSTLDGLLQKITRGQQLADRDWQLAQQLAAEEREFARQKELIALETANKIKQQGADSAWLQGFLSKGAPTASTQDISSSSTGATRAGNTDNINFNGNTYTREDFAQIYSAMQGLPYEDVLREVYSQFPDISRSGGGGGW